VRRLLALVVTSTLVLAAPAVAGGPDQIVTASPTADGAQIHRAGVQVVTTRARTIDSTNLARATPSDCTGCAGTAVAFQAVIATGDPTSVTPTNAAVAVNSECTSCEAFAYAYQYVVSADRGLSEHGREEIADIRGRAQALVRSDLPDPELRARLDALAAEFKAAVVEDLQRSAADPEDEDEDEDADEGEED